MCMVQLLLQNAASGSGTSLCLAWTAAYLGGSTAVTPSPDRMLYTCDELGCVLLTASA